MFQPIPVRVMPPGDATRAAVAAEHCLAEVDDLLTVLERQACAPSAAPGRLTWRSAAAELYETRLAGLRDRLTTATAVVAGARHDLARQAAELRALADVSEAPPWPRT